jgi:NAD(P)H-dependent flavin oxidoreductase YrpB (nitropropane dioxygenase family)
VRCTSLSGVLRALKTPLMERCIELEARGATTAVVTELYSGGFREGMGAGIIRETKRAGDIVRDIIKEAERVTAGLG